jgi:hypothetical protein
LERSKKPGRACGNRCGLQQARFRKPNDVVELEIDGLGTLRNRFVKT